MSTATASPRSKRAAPVRATPPSSRPLRPAPPPAPARAPFVIVVVSLLSLGLGALLLLNTLLAQGSFTLHELNAEVAELADREQALQQRASERAAPQRLARRAEALGMVPSTNPAFLRTSDGKVLGEPVAAVGPLVPALVVGSGDPEAEVPAAPAADTSSTGDSDNVDKNDQTDKNDNNKNDDQKSQQDKSDDEGNGGQDR